MRYIFTSRKCSLTDDVKAYAEKKLKKLDKFFAGDSLVTVIFSIEKNDTHKVEVTADYQGIIFRAQEKGKSFKECIDRLVDILIRQIRRHKTKLEKRLKDTSFDFGDEGQGEVVDEAEDNIIKIKKIEYKPMSTDEAILQMEMVGHDFFVFIDAEDKEVKVLYKRQEGNYGLIEPQD